MSLNLYRYALKMRQGGHKDGLLIEQEGRWGEVTPLPGWSRETGEEALLQLKNLNQTREFFPSVAFGLDSVQCKKLLKKISLPVAALLKGTEEEILEKAARRKKEGFTHAKLKIGHLPLETAFTLVQSLRSSFRLRIDLNRAWPLKESLDFFSHFKEEDFDYVEEPVPSPDSLSLFPLPFALDETHRELPAHTFLSLPLLKAFIFKPTLDGGILALNQLKTLNKPIILSSSYESGIGLFQIAALIQRANLTIYPIGIDTYHDFENDLLETPLTFHAGEVHLPSSIQPHANQIIRI